MELLQSRSIQIITWNYYKMDQYKLSRGIITKSINTNHHVELLHSRSIQIITWNYYKIDQYKLSRGIDERLSGQNKK